LIAANWPIRLSSSSRLARARQLLAGSTPRVAVGEHKKTTVAQQEVITKQVEKIEGTLKPEV
jgi:hypothetical protein